MKPFLLTICLLFAQYLMMGQTTQTTIVELSTDSLPQYEIPSTAITYYLDSLGTQTLQSIIQNLALLQIAPPKKSIKIPNDISHTWLRFAVKNTTSQPIKILLRENIEGKTYYYLLDSLNRVVAEDINGDLATWDEKKGFKTSYEAVFVLAPQQTYNFLIHYYTIWSVKRNVTINLPIIIYNAKHKFEVSYYHKTSTKIGFLKDYFSGMIVGIVFVMAIYNLFIFFTVRERSYLYFVLFLLPTGMFFMYSQNFSNVIFFPNEPVLEESLRIHYIFLLFVFFIWFTQALLATRQRFPRWHQWLKILWIAETLMHTANVINYFFGTPQLGDTLFNMSDVLLLVIVISCISIAVYALFKKYQPAKYYILACFMSLFCTIVYIVLHQAKGEVGIVQYLVQIGVVLMIILLSLSLSDKINLLKKEITQKELEKEAQRRQLIEQQTVVLEQQVALRTTELREANEELNQTNEELSVTLEKLQVQSDEIAKQHEDIKASINYALRIQTAILPTTAEMQQLLGNYFVFFRPRDIVSGDFYYLTTVKNLNEQYENQLIVRKNFLAVIDCTGHGVPGAFMSLIGNDILNETIKNKNITESHQILRQLNKGVQAALRQSDNNNQDGMEVALCIMALNAQQATAYIEYAGARQNLYYVQQEQLFEIQG
ncbi:MAG: 7TM diverse intracellular signaling domain-containing protein, partial [Thermoflexibacteraceae bacterium]